MRRHFYNKCQILNEKSAYKQQINIANHQIISFSFKSVIIIHILL